MGKLTEPLDIRAKRRDDYDVKGVWGTDRKDIQGPRKTSEGAERVNELTTESLG